MAGNADRPGFELDGVRVTLGGVEALRGVDLTVRPGDLHCLVGPNGSGKTTLLSVLLGLRRPTAGRVERRAASVGCSFQQPSVYPDLTVDENLRVFAGFGDSGRSVTGADESWLDTLRGDLGFEDVASRRVDRLSGGYRVLLDVALAFVGRPQYVLLDEPLRSLDDLARERLLSFLADYRTDDRTVFVSTHRIGPFEPVLDRLTVLEDGLVVCDDDRAALDDRADGSGDPDVRSRYLDLVDGDANRVERDDRR